MRPLTRDEAIERAALIDVRSYELEFDLTTGPETFRTRTRIRFECREPGRSTFAEHFVPRLRSVALNGAEVDLGRVDGDGRITLDGLAAENDLLVDAEPAYSPSLEGLQRSVDPEDGEVYLFSESFLDFGQRMFACFDQPDLKATFGVSVTAPIGWTVLSNGAGQQIEPGRWTFSTTPPLPTYLFALAAGRYHSVTAEHDGIPLGLHCRRSMAKYLDADELFDDTRRGIDYYQRLFGAPYPFEKYDQLFVPEMGGAMENAALVTFDDSFLFRSPVTDDRRRERSEVVLHELAHMWFGDLVTMRWWDDLWLNESFATYLAFRTLTEATRHRTAWTAFALGDKAWGYRQDELPTTHPVSADVPDTAAALLNFDGISYTKGAGVLKQLVAWVGDEPFESGLRAYIAEHPYGTTSLADLLRALEAASARSLGPWAAAWLQTAGIATLRPVHEVGPDGRYLAAAIEQIAPSDQPTLRSHRIAIGLFERDGDRLVRRDRLEIDVAGSRTDVPALVGRPVPALLLLNDDDLTWAKVRLDEPSLQSVRGGAIPLVDEPLARALLWLTLLDMMRDAELSVGDCLAVLLPGLASERDIGMLVSILDGARFAIQRFGRPSRRADRLSAFSARTSRLLTAAASGSDAQLAFARAAIEAATDPDDLDRLQGWLAGHAIPDGLELGPELRWAIVARLAVLGRIDSGAIDTELERDPTTAGAQAAATARAGLPGADAKEAAWQALLAADETPLGLRRAIARGLWRPEQLDVARPFLGRYFSDVGALFAGDSLQLARALATRAFPTVLVEPETLAALDRALAEPGLDPTFRRILGEHRADLVRAQRTRERDDAD